MFKKITSVCCVLLIAVGMASCGTSQTINIQEKDAVSQAEKSTIKNGSILFSTEYDIEDYCQDTFIVSKSDGRLYGVLDMKGKEIIPVKYDNIEFMNKDDVMSGSASNLYIKTTYEGENEVKDTSGKTILNGDISCIKYKFKGYDKDSPFFIECKASSDVYYTGQDLKIYSEDGTLLNEFASEDGERTYLYSQISKECYLLSESNVKKGTAAGSYNFAVDYVSTKLCRKSNEVISEWPETTVGTGKLSSNQECMFSLTDSSTSSICISVNENGEVLSQESFNNATGATMRILTQTDKEQNLLDSDTARLYSSNGTFKLEDNNGNPLYDERYYKAVNSLDGENDCTLLFDENDRCCLIDRNGILRVDYGTIEQRSNNLYVNGQATNNGIYEGESSVCFAVKNDNKWDIYYFNGQQ